MEQGTKNIICLLLNVLILPGLGTIIHGEGKRGLIQIAVLIVSIPLAIVLLAFLTWVGSSDDYLIGFLSLLLVGILLLTLFLVWLWALLDGVAFVQNREFYVFKNLK